MALSVLCGSTRPAPSGSLDDVATVGSVGLDGLVLPKAKPAAVECGRALGLPVVAIVETAGGSPGRVRAGCDPGRRGARPRRGRSRRSSSGWSHAPDGLELLFARSSLVVDSAAAGCAAPIDQSGSTLRDDAGLEARLPHSRARSGSAARPASTRSRCPSSTTRSRRRATSSRARATWSARTSDAAAKGRGAVALDGEMIDLPVVERARQLLADAKRSVLYGD